MKDENEAAELLSELVAQQVLYRGLVLFTTYVETPTGMRLVASGIRLLVRDVLRPRFIKKSIGNLRASQAGSINWTNFSTKDIEMACPFPY